MSAVLHIRCGININFTQKKKRKLRKREDNSDEKKTCTSSIHANLFLSVNHQYRLLSRSK